MDAVAEIKARLSIDQLVGQYCQLTKKGRNFVALCPFHHDTHPSFLVSPDKGICYCFPCQKGGDIFNFYQLIEGVDFPQALKDLADQAGVTLQDRPAETVKKDEKERARECLRAAQAFYAHKLRESPAIVAYLSGRGVSAEESAAFGLGFAPDSFQETYEHLLKTGFSRKEILAAGLGVQKDLREERIYDRFRNRLMFPIHDHQGRIIGFGGRTMGDDDAKYLNSSDGPLYRKSAVLYGLHQALPAIREQKRIVLVEGYFDVLACHRVGVRETVATCGTALTEEHVRLIKRSAECVVLCMDRDGAGKAAAERAFMLCSKEGLRVEGVMLGQKDPADAAVESQASLRSMLQEKVRPFLDIVFAEVRTMDTASPVVRQAALDRLLPLLSSIRSVTEKSYALSEAANVIRAKNPTDLEQDLLRYEKTAATSRRAAVDDPAIKSAASLYSGAELTLGLVLLYPRTIALLKEMIRPDDGFASMLYDALLTMGDRTDFTTDDLPLSPEDAHRAGVLQLYCEESGFGDWNDGIAMLEIRRNCRMANRELLQRRQRELTQRMAEARAAGKNDEGEALAAQYRELLLLSKQTA